MSVLRIHLCYLYQRPCHLNLYLCAMSTAHSQAIKLVVAVLLVGSATMQCLLAYKSLRLLKTESEEEGEEDIVDAGDIEPLEPKSLTEVKHRLEWLEWEKAIHEELKTLEDGQSS